MSYVLNNTSGLSYKLLGITLKEISSNWFKWKLYWEKKKQDFFLLFTCHLVLALTYLVWMWPLIYWKQSICIYMYVQIGGGGKASTPLS